MSWPSTCIQRDRTSGRLHGRETREGTYTAERPDDPCAGGEVHDAGDAATVKQVCRDLADRQSAADLSFEVEARDVPISETWSMLVRSFSRRSTAWTACHVRSCLCERRRWKTFEDKVVNMTLTRPRTGT